ncbi:MAG: hypothetical protein ACYS32_00265 [Planctomycetota bacterium]|jgi:hypothetical protein
MAKRIPSRVIKSRPLSDSRDGGSSHNFRTRIDGIHTGNSQGKSISNSVIYTRVLGITRISKDNDPAGRMLDCYV